MFTETKLPYARILLGQFLGHWLGQHLSDAFYCTCFTGLKQDSKYQPQDWVCQLVLLWCFFCTVQLILQLPDSNSVEGKKDSLKLRCYLPRQQLISDVGCWRGWGRVAWASVKRFSAATLQQQQPECPLCTRNFRECSRGMWNIQNYLTLSA